MSNPESTSPPSPATALAAQMPRKALLTFGLFALVGVVFAGVSTYDFIAHLDRQVHAITCSIVPGLSAPDTTGSSGCHAVLISPYSSLMRDYTWGGIPIALPALGVFAFLLFRAIDLLLRRQVSRRETGFLILASLLPVLTSLVYGAISVTKIGSFCKVCVGIYFASFGVLVCAIVAQLATRAEAEGKSGRPLLGLWGFYFVEGVALVALPLLLYLALKPSYPQALLQTSGLRHPEDRLGVMLNLPSMGRVPATEIVDPLCPACKAFSERLAASDLARDLQLKLVLFPLDKECNWMVGESVHPGACAVSEAVLCAGDRAAEVLAWAFANQAELHTLGTSGQHAIAARIRHDFPGLAACIGGAVVKARLNKSLRWIVANSLPVLTPQLFVGNQKIPDEDTDLGLDYVLGQVLAQRGAEVGR